MRAGDVLGDSFELERQAARGGMGSVWRARDKQGAPVAIKVLRGEVDEAHLARFAREAQILADLEHPHIVRYIAHGTTPAGSPFLAMEWLEGEDLEARLAREGIGGRDALELVRRAATALCAAHERGIVHRDVKPSNLFLPGGRIEDVKLLDFGIARFDGAARRMTKTGALVGTLGYMAPEQAAGDTDIDARVDVYALGCVLFECFTGRRVFVGEQPAVVLAKLQLSAAPRLAEQRPDVPPALDELVAKMLARQRDGRPRDAAEVATALEKLAAETTLAPIVLASNSALTAEERRLVTVLVVGRTSDLEPSQVALVDTIARRHGARLEVRGDRDPPALVVEDGSSSDRAAELARCALNILRVLPEVPMAIATGPAVMAPRPRLAELCARATEMLEQVGAGEAGAIRVDAASEALLLRRFDLGRSKDGATSLRAEHDLTASPRPLGRQTPMFGRERDLASLEGLYDDCVAEPVARVAVITGPAGIGKTRVCQELVAKLAARDPAPTIWTTRATRGLKDQRLAVIADLLTRAGGAVPTPNPDAGTRSERDTSVKQGSDTRTTDGELSAAFVAAARGVAEQGPLVVVVEDYDWIDAGSVRSLAGAVKALRALPLLLVALARDEGNDRLGAALDPDALEVRLGRLGRRASERFVSAALAPRAFGDVIAKVCGQGQGNPLYLEELVAAEARRGEGSAWRSPAAFSEPSVPTSSGAPHPDAVIAIAQEQLDALEPDARRVLRAASVFGEEFTAAGVAVLLRGALADKVVRTRLEELERAGIVTRRDDADPRVAQWEVRTPLLRDAAYASLTVEDRALAHRLVDAWRRATW